jgi:hypothetical protein
MNKTTAAARIAARTIHPLDSHVPAERAARIAQDHILSVPALREITPADILAAHKAAARAVVLDSPIPSPAECDAQMRELHAGDSAACAACATAAQTIAALTAILTQAGGGTCADCGNLAHELAAGICVHCAFAAHMA